MARCGLCGVHGALCFPCGCWFRGSTRALPADLVRPGPKTALSHDSDRDVAVRPGPWPLP
ncbi:hypothetical protein NY78_1995 [Desulfovibrio sp. TomC]|nr:hypothetical protein NY78_1995 [Desulfovibrio sp. TomC]